MVLESIHRARQRGLNHVQAAIDGTTEVGAAVVASTLTTIAVFLPIVFVEGVAGQLFGDQALTVTFSLIASLLVAVTVIPMFSAMGGGNKQVPVQDEVFTHYRKAYKTYICLRHFFLRMFKKFY